MSDAYQTLGVRVDVDERHARRQLAQLGALANVKVQSEFDGAQVQRALTSAARGRSTVAVNVSVDQTRAAAALNDALKQVQRTSPALNVNVDVDPSELAANLTAAIRNVQPLLPPVNIRTDVDPGVLVADTLQAVAAAQGAAPYVDVRMDIDPAQLSASVASAALIAQAAAPTIDIPVGINQASAAAAGAASGTVFGGAFRVAFLAVAVTLFAGLAGGAAIFGVGTKLTADFEAQLSGLRVEAQASTDQLAVLRGEALRYGKDTVFSASEAVAAQRELAKAGLPTQDIIGGGLAGALGLASAGEIDLAAAAEVTATTLNAFGLAGGDATRVADTLAAGAVKSATSVDGLRLGLSQSALVANQAGLTLEETAGALSLFAQNGLKGSDAGTSLKTALLALTPKSEEAGKAMAKLGLEFTNADGSFKSLNGIAQTLQTSLAGMSEEQRQTTLKTIFGTDAIRAATLLYEAGGPGVDKWTQAVTDSGFAAEVARGKLDNLKGDLENLKGSFETAFIEAGSAGQTGLRNLVQSLTGTVNTLGPSLGGIFTAFGGVLTAIVPLLGPVLTLISEFVTAALPGISAGLAALQPAFVALAPVAEAFGKAIGSVFAAVGPLIAELVVKFAPIVTSLLDLFARLLPVVEPLLPLLLGFVNPWLLLLPAITELLPKLSPLFAKLGDLATKIAPSLVTIMGAVVDMFVQFAGPIIDAVIPAIDDIAAAFLPLIGTLIDELAPILPELGRAFGELVAAIVPLLPDILKLAVVANYAWLPLLIQGLPIVVDLISGLVFVVEKVVGVLGFVGPLVDTIVKSFAALVGGDFSAFFAIWEQFGTRVNGALTGVADSVGRWFFDTLLPVLTGAAGSVWNWISQTLLPGIGNGIAALPGILWDAFSNAFIFLLGGLGSIVSGVLGFFVSLPFQLVGALIDFAAQLVTWAVEAFRWLRDNLPRIAADVFAWFAELPNRIVGFLTSFPGKLYDWAANGFNWLWTNLSGLATDVFNWFRDLPSKIVTTIGNLGGTLFNAGKDLLTGLLDGMLSMGAAAGGIAKDIVNAIIRFINDNVIAEINSALVFDIAGVSINPPDIPGIPFLADGAVLNKATLAVIGEAGQEVVLPTTKPLRAGHLLTQAGLSGVLSGPHGQIVAGNPTTANTTTTNKTVNLTVNESKQPMLTARTIAGLLA